MIEELRRFRNQRPFVPYTIVLTDGRELPVRDQFHVSIGGNRFVTVVDESSDWFEFMEGSDIREIKAGVATAETAH